LHQQEHFPPKKFLQRHLDVVTNRHFVWSICKKHNGEMKGFIARMPLDAPMPPNILKIADGIDPLRIYSAAANLWIKKFYKAFQDNDIAAATEAVRAVIGLWKALALLPTRDQLSAHEQPLRNARTTGKRAYSAHDSQLSVFL
jgi:hypothetical protein